MLLHSPDIMLDLAKTQNGTLPIRVGSHVLGTVDQLDEKGQRFWLV